MSGKQSWSSAKAAGSQGALGGHLAPETLASQHLLLQTGPW